MKKITKTALILATSLSASLFVASNVYADDSEGFQSTVIQCGPLNSSTVCGINPDASITGYPLKSGSITIRGNGEIKVRLVNAKPNTTFSVLEGIWPDPSKTSDFITGLQGSSALGCNPTLPGYKALGIITTNAQGKFDGKILKAAGPPKIYYSIPNGTKQSVINFAFNDVLDCSHTQYVTGIKVDARNDPAD